MNACEPIKSPIADMRVIENSLTILLQNSQENLISESSIPQKHFFVAFIRFDVKASRYLSIRFEDLSQRIKPIKYGSICEPKYLGLS